MAAFDPFDENVGTKIDIPYFFYLIQHERGNVIFDSGAHPSLATDPRARLGDEADNWEIRMSPEDGVVDRLAKVGLAPEDITHVIQSHLHYDHAGGIEFFPHAPVYVQRDELAFASAPPVYQAGLYVKADYEVPGVRWHELDGEHDVFGDGRLVLVPTPGHSAGHQSLIVRLESGPVILLADAAYLVEKMRTRSLPAVVWSPDHMVASWEKIERLERELDAILVATHDLKFRDRIRLAPEAWYE
jgi:glyoxylase-like metal-dependent hydrolase (beta-lactamase superfamily II)